MSAVDAIADQILRDLMEHFVGSGASANALKDGYEGLSLATLKERYAQGSVVDFDLAISGLEKRGFVKSGPMAAYDNNRNSAVIVLGFYSKREYLCLRESGYREVQRIKPLKQASPERHTVQISGGTFYQSPIGVGETVSQSLTVNINDHDDVVRYLADLAKAGGFAPDATAEAREIVSSVEKGDLAATKSVFKAVFGVASEGVRSVAWGVISALIAQQLGVS